MRLVTFSDTHTRHRQVKIPDGDVLIFAGDGEFRKASDLVDFNDWLAGFKHPNKIVIAGNHDFFCEQFPEDVQKYLTAAVYLRDQRHVLPNGTVIWGTPMTQIFMNWAFMGADEVLERDHWRKIPADTDILLSHGPVYGHLDNKAGHGHLGSRTLALRVESLAIPYVIHGHIHEGYGMKTVGQTTYVNCSVLDEQYQLLNAAIVLDI